MTRRRLDVGFGAGQVILLAGALMAGRLLPGASAVELLFAAMLIAAGLGFTRYFLAAPARWSLPPAAGMIGAGLVVGADTVAPGALADRSAVLPFILVGVCLVLLAALPPRRWQPLLPAGLMLTLAATIAAGADSDAGGVLLAGLAGTFLGVYLLPPAPLRRLWALMAAAALVLPALPASGLPVAVFGIVIAITLLAAGTLLLLRGPGAPA